MMNNTKKMPIGIQSFQKLREDGFLYVDKTEYIYNLVKTEVPVFLSRPRRFGKSLLLSAMKAYWEGRKDLFDGLKIEELEAANPEAWQSYPVFYFDFNRDNYGAVSALEGVLESHLSKWERLYDVVPKDSHSLAVRFQNVILEAYEKTGKRCVVLVDEYDKPLLETVDNKELIEHNKALFKGFFSSLKSEDAYLKFVFITGVTKFSKVSIFSDLNQLEDISFDDDYSGLCGITEDELENYFITDIEIMARDRSMTITECKEKLKKTYNGYHFSANGVGVYNPYSVMSALKKRRFGAFWFETGTPTFLVKKLKEMDFDVRPFSEMTIETSEVVLSDYRTDNPDPVPLLYQSGYLTIIKGVDEDVLRLGFPNDEVRYAFLQSLMPEYVNECGTGSGKDVFALKKYAEDGNTEGIKKILIALFASISYTNNDTPFEHYFQTVIFLVFTLLGKYAVCEMHTCEGRIDCIVETKKYVYIFEFKRDGSADEAVKQILERNYAAPYEADERKLYRIGANFSSNTRQLNDWKVI